jgi:hypothetical protein
VTARSWPANLLAGDKSANACKNLVIQMSNTNSRGQQRDKPYRDALRMELAAAEAAGNGMKTLRSIARKHIALADRGDMQAIRELADRLDGKPAQAVETTGELAHRYVIEAPAQLSNEEWEKKYGTSASP